MRRMTVAECILDMKPGSASQSARSWKKRCRRIGPSKVDEDDVIFASYNIAVSTSDRMHGGTPEFLLPLETKIQCSGAP